MEQEYTGRTQEEQERLSRVVDGLPAWKLLQVMSDSVGVKRSAELMGWAVVWGLTGETSGVALRDKLKAQGMTQRSAYRAITDYRRIGDELLKLDDYAGAGVLTSLRRLAASISL